MATQLEQELHNAEVSVEFEDEREESLVREAVLGRDAQDWMHTSVGRFVLGAAVQDQRDIEEKLATINPNTRWRRRRIEDLQLQHRAITRAVSWLSQAVQLGMMAERELQQPQE